MMLNPNQLRQALTDSLKLLQRSSDSLNMLIDNGRIVSTLASLLSFEYQYQLNLVITDYGDNLDLLTLPLLAWLRVKQPDILASEEKRRTGFTFNADFISDTAVDISINLQLIERVIVKEQEGELHVNHVGEPSLPENNSRPWQLHVKNELISEWLS